MQTSTYYNTNFLFFSGESPLGKCDFSEKIGVETDHLGNVRLSYAQRLVTEWTPPQVSYVNKLVVLDESHYYPFGLKMQGLNSVKLNPDYKYSYNGKELQDELGLNMHDYGARNYDASLGRWMNIDPLSEKYYDWSTYTYTLNNPIFFIDPDGMQVDDWYLNKETLDYEWHDGSEEKEGYEKIETGTNVVVGNDNFELQENGEFTNINRNKKYEKGESVDLGQTGTKIVSNKTIKEKVITFTSEIVAPFTELPQDVLFPIINQIGVVAKEGLHEGQARNFDNVILPNTYELKDWSFEKGRKHTSNGNLSKEEGQEIINNTISVIPSPFRLGQSASFLKKKALNMAATSAAKTTFKKSTEKVE